MSIHIIHSVQFTDEKDGLSKVFDIFNHCCNITDLWQRGKLNWIESIGWILFFIFFKIYNWNI